MIQFKQQRRSRFSLLFKIAFQTESDQHVLTQEEIEEEAVLSANLKRNLANKALVCLYKLSFDDTDRCCNGIVRYRETESSERFAQWARGSERGLQPRICDRVIRADDIPVPGWKGRLSLISLLSKGLYQMTINEKKGPDWVMLETKYLLMMTLLKKVIL